MALESGLDEIAPPARSKCKGCGGVHKAAFASLTRVAHEVKCAGHVCGNLVDKAAGLDKTCQTCNMAYSALPEVQAVKGTGSVALAKLPHAAVCRPAANDADKGLTAAKPAAPCITAVCHICDTAFDDLGVVATAQEAHVCECANALLTAHTDTVDKLDKMEGDLQDASHNLAVALSDRDAARKEVAALTRTMEGIQGDHQRALAAQKKEGAAKVEAARTEAAQAGAAYRTQTQDMRVLVAPASNTAWFQGVSFSGTRNIAAGKIWLLGNIDDKVNFSMLGSSDVDGGLDGPCTIADVKDAFNRMVCLEALAYGPEDPAAPCFALLQSNEQLDRWVEQFEADLKAANWPAGTRAAEAAKMLRRKLHTALTRWKSNTMIVLGTAFAHRAANITGTGLPLVANEVHAPLHMREVAKVPTLTEVRVLASTADVVVNEYKAPDSVGGGHGGSGRVGHKHQRSTGSVATAGIGGRSVTAEKVSQPSAPKRQAQHLSLIEEEDIPIGSALPAELVAMRANPPGHISLAIAAMPSCQAWSTGGKRWCLYQAVYAPAKICRINCGRFHLDPEVTGVARMP